MSTFTIGAQNNIANNHKSGSLFAGNLRLIQGGTLKSTQEKLERQQKANNQIEFLENQKENLKNMKCDTVEEIEKKLEMFHNYEDEIAAVKAQYNNEQMFHILDEAEEQGEKNAEAAKKMEPKTPEERREELAKEALGEEENEGLLDEMLDEITDAVEEVSDVEEELMENEEEALEELAYGKENSMLKSYLAKQEEERQNLYRGLDVRI